MTPTESGWGRGQHPKREGAAGAVFCLHAPGKANAVDGDFNPEGLRHD